MQKLTFLKSNRGSVLVGAVVVCAVLGIAVAGLKGVVRNTVSQEVEAHDDARLFLAAESGLHMLTDWAVQAVLNDEAITPGTDNLTFDDRDGVGTVSVELKITPRADLGNRFWELASTASLPGRLPYSKTIEWVIDLPQTAEEIKRPTGYYGAIVNNAKGEETNKNNYGLTNQHFNGPTHFNSPITINHTGKETSLRFNGAVTMFLADKTPYRTTYISVGDDNKSPRGNYYNYGFIAGSNNLCLTFGCLDPVFWDGTIENREEQTGNVPFEIVNDPVRVGMSTSAGIHRDTLSSGVSKLHFGVNGGEPYYCLNDNCAVLNRVPIDKPIVFYAPGNLTVSTTATENKMLGNVTVETRGNLTIDLTHGDLTYNWYNTPFEFTNKDIPTSGSVDKFNDEASKGNNGGMYADVLSFFSHGNIILSSGHNSGGRALTAQLFANGDESKIERCPKNKGQITLIGTASTNIFWDFSGTSSNNELQGHWFHDTRGLNAYGVELIAPPLPLVRFNWRETNCEIEAVNCPPPPQI
jgi:hypothetical protein